MYRDIPDKLRDLIEPLVVEHLLELVDVSFARGRVPWRFRVIVDTPLGDGRVPLDRCAELSRELATHLDAANAIEKQYTLEVSSPGLDRMLSREKDFSVACGSTIRLETQQALDGARHFRGRLLSFNDGVARVLVEGIERAIPFSAVTKANTLYEWTREDFAKD